MAVVVPVSSRAGRVVVPVRSTAARRARAARQPPILVAWARPSGELGSERDNEPAPTFKLDFRLHPDKAVGGMHG